MKRWKHSWALLIVVLTVVALVWSVMGVTAGTTGTASSLGSESVVFDTLDLPAVADTYIHSWFPATNFSTAWSLTLRSGDVAAPLFKFDLAALPTTPQLAIAEATLKVYVSSRTNAADMGTTVYPLLRPWVGTQATWTKADSETLWAKPGANDATDRGAAVSSVTLSGAGMWVSYDVTTMVRAWARGEMANNGLVLKSNGEAAVSFAIASSENDNVALRPVLHIVYTEIPDVLPTETPTITPTPMPAVLVDKAGPQGPLQLDGYNNLTYTIVVRNPGAQAVSNVAVTDVIPLGTEVISATHSGAYVPVESLVVWNVGALAAGESVTLGVTLGVPAWVKAEGNVVNLARASCTECTGLAEDYWEVPVFMGPTPTPRLLYLVELHKFSGWAPRR